MSTCLITLSYCYNNVLHHFLNTSLNKNVVDNICDIYFGNFFLKNNIVVLHYTNLTMVENNIVFFYNYFTNFKTVLRILYPNTLFYRYPIELSVLSVTSIICTVYYVFTWLSYSLLNGFQPLFRNVFLFESLGQSNYSISFVITVFSLYYSNFLVVFYSE